MRIVFMGTPQVAADTLISIKDKHEIVGVVTQPDKIRGRCSAPQPSPVKQVAQKYLQVPVVQPISVKEPAFIEQVKAWNPELALVVAYGHILSQAFLKIPRWGCVNIHYSLLPRLRGAAPIQQAILQAESHTGITIMRMEPKMDAGSILDQRSLAIDETMSAGQLEKQLFQLSLEPLLATLERIEQGSCLGTPQQESLVTLAPKIHTHDAQIDWGRSALEIKRLVHAMDPSPGAWCWLRIKGVRKRLKIFAPCQIVAYRGAPGHIVSVGEYLIVSTGQDALVIEQLQLEGRARTLAYCFAQGYCHHELVVDNGKLSL